MNSCLDGFGSWMGIPYPRIGPDGPEILMAAFLLDVSAKLKAHRG